MNPMINGQFTSIEQVTGQFLTPGSVKRESQTSDISFEDVLRAKQSDQVLEASELKFSKHATMRLQSRGIQMTESLNARLENGVEQASEKGIKESLVLVDQLAFIVNVPNKTVVTAMDQTETNSNVFTNIDGAVII